MSTLWKQSHDLIEAVHANTPHKEVIDGREELVKLAVCVSKKVQMGQVPDPEPVLSSLGRILDEDVLDELYPHAMSLCKDGDFPHHTTCVTLGSLKVGKAMAYGLEEQLRLGLAAFFGNLGLLVLPESLRGDGEDYNPNNNMVLDKHPEISARILSQLGPAFDWLPQVTLQVHERSDGTGHPRGLKGNEISEFASIIGLYDVYVTLVCQGDYGKSNAQAEAVKIIIDSFKSQFPPKVMKAFVNEISLFPINTYVRLNNNTMGRVISINRDQPLRPSIEVISKGLGLRQRESRVVNLAEMPLLHITDTIDEKALH